jgi:hypothetical protein
VSGVCSAGAAQVFTRLVELNKAPAVVTVLKGAEDVLVRQAQVGVRMHVAVDIRERAADARMQRIAQIEEKGAAGIVIVGEEDAAGGHGVFSVVHEFGLLVGGEGGQELTVVCRCGRRIDDGEKVGLLARCVASPDEEVMLGRGLVHRRCGERRNGETASERKSKSEAEHAFHPDARGKRDI